MDLPANQAAAAAASLQLLLREDPLLQANGLTKENASTFAYAASLLHQDDNNSISSTQQRADLALQDVERKLALVESLAIKLSRTSPEAVAGHLLRLHGHDNNSTITSENNNNSTSSSLQSIRERTDRLERQAAHWSAVAQRVESSLTRIGQDRMATACTKLQRVLQLSATLKKLMQWQFEYSKLQTYDLDNVRDLTRAAASVAVLPQPGNNDDDDNDDGIAVLDEMRPQAAATARAVRQAAARLWQSAKNGSLSQLGATLTVYYHLGELPAAVWQAVQDAHALALAACRDLWNPTRLTQLTEVTSGKAKQVRSQAAQDWAQRVQEAAAQVQNLERVLRHKTDPIQRHGYMHVVAAAPIPNEYAAFGNSNNKSPSTFSLVALFWGRFCQSLAETIDGVLAYEQGKLAPDVAALYPAVRASSLDMVGRLFDSSSATSSVVATSGFLEEETAGILGGSAALEDSFLEWTTTSATPTAAADNPQTAASADTWTLPSNNNKGRHVPQQQQRRRPTQWLAVASLAQWKELQGSHKNPIGLYLLEQAFLTSCRDRLQTPLHYMFPEHVKDDDDEHAATALLPSKYDVQRFDENIRQELALADPRQGGGDVSALPMITACVVDMMADFCLCAKNALRGGDYVRDNDWSMTERLQHDRKVVAILYTLANYLRQAPEKTFVAPYRPSTLLQHQEAAELCQSGLEPALDAIDKTVQSAVINPLCRALNHKIAAVLAKMHFGIYLEDDNIISEASPAFVQLHLAPVFDLMTQNLLSKFPPPYAALVAATVATYTTYSFVSNASLLRPLGESARLHITQDLADLELTLDLFMGGVGGSLMAQLGRPYAELRAVRQMLFWSGLEMKTTPSPEVAKALLREPWIKDVRPSTVLHYLLSYAPSLLSSPHHHGKRTAAHDYVRTAVVRWDGSTAEDDAWMTTMACCDSYQQRAAAAASSHVTTDGDARVADILLNLGPELLRRQRR